jgi:hypothetical protein
VTEASPLKSLPVLLGAVRQKRLDGELLLEQNDGGRQIFFSRGEIIHLKSDVAGEQFGNYLLRQGILDFPALNELLANEERYRLGEKVIQWGMMSLDERDQHLTTLQEQIMVHALEHPVVSFTWTGASAERHLEQDLHFSLHHRRFLWTTFQESTRLTGLLDLLASQPDWRWEGPRDLLETISDLPLTPATAFALSFLGADPIGFQTFRSLSGLEEEEAGRLIAALWAIGGLELTQGTLPALTPPPVPVEPPAAPEGPGLPPAPPRRSVAPPSGSLPFILPPPGSVPRVSLPPLELDPRFAALPLQPEFLDIDPDPADRPALVKPAVPAPPTPEPAATEPPGPAPTAEPGPAAHAEPPPSPPPSPTDENEDPAVRARKLLRRARLEAMQDRTVEAVRTLERSVQLLPEGDGAYDAWLMLGQLRVANPAWSTRAIDALQNASRIRPKAAEPWAAMGEVYHRKGFPANAVACFRRALELDPSVPVPPDVDLNATFEADADPTPSGGGLFSRLRSMLGRSDKQ